MTLQEFIETRPQSYGRGNINLLYSSSVSGSDDVPIPPYHIQGLSIPFTTLGGTNIGDALREVETFRFDYPTGQLSAEITGRQQRNEYYYFTVKEIVTTVLPSSVDFSGNPILNDSQTVFVPFVSLGFNNSDYNPLGNNSEGSSVNPYAQKVDRNTSQFNPTNLAAINTGTATDAELQESSYSSAGIINGRYNGSKTTAAGPISREYHKGVFTQEVLDNSIAANNPATTLVTFQGSIHASDADTTAIKNILNADREVVEILFDSTLSGSHPNKIFPSFAKTSNTLFALDGNKTFKLTNNKVYSIDTDSVLTTNNVGTVTLVE